VPAARAESPAEAGPPEPPPGADLVTRPAAEVCRLFVLGDAARALLDGRQAVLPFLYRLLKERLYVDAVRLLAHALPGRRGARWASQCVRARAGANPPAATAAALQAAEAWVAAPTEANRRASLAAAAAAGYGTPAGSAALAAALGGDPLAPPSRAGTPAEALLGARAVANAVLLAALSVEPENAPGRYLQFLKDGLALEAATPQRLVSFSP
jgi:hypothetical protein